jgi:2',3'-cyclic-nucleotide 2'-phosphodiesterase (5'-nucleotidase family)
LLTHETVERFVGLTFATLMTRVVFVLSFVLACAIGFAQDVRSAANPVGQSIADEIRAAAGAEIAFITSGVIKTNYSGNDLAEALDFPEDELVVSSLRGSQILEALERSVALFPQNNSAFLQVSGLSVTFDPARPSGSRVTLVEVNGSRLDPSRIYSVAMPNSLAIGGAGYFKIWDKGAISRRLGQTIESVVKGKSPSAAAPRYTIG